MNWDSFKPQEFYQKQKELVEQSTTTEQKKHIIGISMATLENYVTHTLDASKNIIRMYDDFVGMNKGISRTEVLSQRNEDIMNRKNPAYKSRNGF